MIHSLQALLKINTYEPATKTFVLPLNNCICFLFFMKIWLIDRFTCCVNQRINQLLCGWNNNSIYFAVSHNWNSFQNQRIGILLLGYHMFSYIFNQSFAHVFDSCMNDWRIESMPIVQAIFIISLTKNNVNNNNIVNEYQNRYW